MSYTFYENQKECATEILEKFKAQSYVILCAQMQSGKTGTYLYAALSMIYHKIIDNIIIVSGVSDKNLREQCMNDKDNAFDSFFEDKVMTGGEVRRIEKSIHVLFSQDLSKMNEISENTLVIWDESHYAQNQSNRPNKWFDTIGLEDVLNGKNLGRLKSKKIFVLSVSATPFSETIDNEKSADKKECVFLKPASYYRGLGKFIENQKVKEAVKIDSKNKNKVKEIFEEFVDSNKYLIVRVHTANYILDEIITELNFGRVSYDMNSKFDLNKDFLSKCPEKTTVILIKAKCRLGYVVHKEFVGLVYETSSDSKADAQFQGLWGRMCGTPSEKDKFEYMPDVYVTKDNIRRGKKYAKSFENDEVPMIDHAHNVPKQSIRRRNIAESEFHPSIPIKLEDIPGFELKDVKDTIQELSGYHHTHPSWNGNNPTQIQELKEMLSSNEKISKRDLSHKSYDSRKMNMVQSYNQKTRDFRFFDPRKEKKSNFLIWMKFEGDGKENGNYFMWWTKNQDEEILRELREESLPKTTGLEAFSVTNEATEETIECNGGQTYHLPKETYVDYALMKSEIYKCVKRNKEDGFSSEICSQYDSKSKTYKGIKFANTIWTEEKIEKMFREIESDFEENYVKVTLKKNKQKGRQSKDYLSFSKIYW
tara:strand:- start:187 stop:2133 length:1947 start_codon:yes stop_codon:yes gene_type:complete